MPVVSVVLPFRNAERFIREAVGSILTQEFADLELLAVDDGSDDRSTITIREMARTDSRVRLLDGRGAGLPAALNLGIAAAAGRYVARMDADDVALPDRLARQVAVLDSHPDLCVLGSAVERVDTAGNLLDIAWFPSSPAAVRRVLAGGQCCLCHPATVIRRDALTAVGGYRTSVPLTEDYDLWLRLMKLGDIANVDRPLLRYRLHGGSVAFHRTTEQLLSLLRSAVLNAGAFSSEEARAIESTDDLLALIRRLAPDREPAAVLVEMATWYVENAAIAGQHAAARRLARQLAAVAPSPARPATARALRAAAALVTAPRAGRLRALRYFLSAGDPRAILEEVPWRAVLAPPRIGASTVAPGPSPDRAGYLDSIHLYLENTRALLFGWVPLDANALPRAMRLVTPVEVASLSLRMMRRPDVARVAGARHLFTGFRIEADLAGALGDVRDLSVWTLNRAGTWTRLNDQDVRIDIGGLR